MSLAQHARPVIEALEPRILYSADLAPGLTSIGSGVPQAESRLLSPTTPTAASTLTEIAFIDATLADTNLLVQDLDAQRANGRAIDIVLIGAGEDGIQRITETLSGRTGIGAIHLFGHGTGGELTLGAGQLDNASLFRSAGAIASWGDAFTADADILIYGCDLAGNAAGVALVDGLAALTGADVAASDDVTGSLLENADWVLEYQRGAIDALIAPSAGAQQAWTTSLATVQIEAFQDTYLNKDSPTLNHGLSPSLVLDKSGGDLGDGRILLSFDLGSIPAGATITNVTLQMQATASTGAMTVQVHEVTQAWFAGLGNGSADPTGANWNQRLFLTPWTTAGGTFNGTPAATLNASGTGQHSWDITALAQAWFARTKINNGLLLGSPDNGSGSITYDSRQGATTPRLVVTYTLPNAAPVITSNGGGAAATINVAENVTAVTTVAATDPDGTTPTYSISGTDAARFTIDPVSGALGFVAAPDFENPQDANGDNIYLVTVVASDGSLTDSQALSVTVTNVNEPPVITSNGGGPTAAINVAENSSAVTTVTATDPEGNSVTYSIIGGADATLFSLHPASGVLTFTAPPNFESPLDANGDNVYLVTVEARHGGQTDTQALSVTVTSVNEAPVITSNSGGPTAAINVAENSTAVTTVTAADPDGTTPTYSISGVDAARFTIDPASGVLSFVTAPDFENPQDANGDNIYLVSVVASDGSLTDSQAISVTVTNVNEPPVITSNGGGATAAINVAENTTAVTTVGAADPEGTAPTYSISGGADAAHFTINPATGILSFVAAPDFENRLDANGDNVYRINVRATSGGQNDTQNLSVTVTNVSEAPVITSNGGGATAAIIVAEGSTAVTAVSASDPDGTTPTYAISGGVDAGLFSLDPVTGALTFNAPPSFAAPLDANGDNLYEVTVSATDGSLTDTQYLAITVAFVNDPPAITSNGGGATADISIAENTTAVTTVTAIDPEGSTPAYWISGGADAALFTLDPATGALRFTDAPDYEAPLDADGDNVYLVTVSASDGPLSDSQELAITVTNANEAPAITSNGGDPTATINVDENSTPVTTVTAADPDGTAPAYSISGVDAVLFTINPVSGVLSFDAAPDFENPQDANGDNVYEVTVSAADGSLADTQDLSITITNVNDNPPVITSYAGAPNADLIVTENWGGYAFITATDADGTSPAYAITGGADWAAFTINPASGEIRFVTSPDFENPLDANGDNVFEIEVSATDGNFTAQQLFNFTVANLNDNAPVITSEGGGATATVTVTENDLAVTTVVASDADGTSPTYSISGGSDAALFALDPTTGVLRFASAPDFDNPLDANGDNVYEVTVSATDGSLTDSQDLSITVTDVNDNAPVITSNGGGAAAAISVTENATAVTTVTATDADIGTLTFSLTGTDAALFTLDPVTGVLRFVNAPDFEAPTDGNGDNAYEITVTATDGSLSDIQALTVTVTNVNDNSPIVSTPLSLITEDGAPLQITGVTVTDADSASGNIQLTLSVSDGVLTVNTGVAAGVPPAATSGNGSGSVTLTGTATALNLTLADAGAGITFLPDPGFAGATTLTASADDLGNPGAGPALTGSASVAIGVTPAPTPPAPPPAEPPPIVPVPDLVAIVPGTAPGPSPIPAPAETAAATTDPESEAPAAVATDDSSDIPGPVLLPPGPDAIGGGTAASAAIIPDGLSAAVRNAPATASAVPEAFAIPQMFGNTLLSGGELRTALERLDFLGQLDALRRSADLPAAFEKQIAGASATASMGLTAGYVLWLLRGGALLASMVSSLPAWHLVDPLPVLRNAADDDNEWGDGDDEVENVFDATTTPDEPDRAEDTALPPSGTRQPGTGP